jgi:hypothetical protein
VPSGRSPHADDERQQLAALHDLVGLVNHAVGAALLTLNLNSVACARLICLIQRQSLKVSTSEEACKEAKDQSEHD